MQISHAQQPAAAASTQGDARPQRRVVDAPTRMFHWLFALSFLGAYVSADGEHWRALHVTLGYTLAGLLGFRVLYGLLGPRPARLAPLLRKLGGASAWLQSIANQGVKWRQGQNLLMALGVLAMLVLAVPLTLSGYGTYKDWGDFLGGDWLEDAHEFFGNAFMALVLGHIALIAILSLLRRRNQALPMFTGRTEGAGPDLVKNNHSWLAALLLASVLAFIGWQWQQSPQGLIPAQGLSQIGTDWQHDDE